MQIHIPTLFLVVVLVNFVLAGALATVGYRRKPELMLWSGSLLLHALAYLLFALRGQVSDFLSIVIANVAISATFALIAEGLFHFLRRRAPRWLIWAPVALTAIVFAGLGGDYLLRALFASLMFGLQGLLLAHFLRANLRGIDGRGKHLFMASAVLISMMLFGRLVALASAPVNDASFQGASFLNTLTYLIAIISVIALVIGLLLMSWERDERTIKESEAHLRMLFESTSDALIILDSDGFIDCNQATLKQFGCAAKEAFLHLTVADISPPCQQNGSASGDLARAHIAGALQGVTGHFEWALKRLDDGCVFVVEVSLNAISIDGRAALLAVMRDITERKAQQQELERRVVARTAELATARAEAESANAVKTRFMANVSHEMRTPMQGILGFARIGKGGIGRAAPEKLGEYFAKIEQSGARLNQLIESLLRIAETAWSEYAALDKERLRAISPVQLVVQCCSMMERSAGQRQQTIVVENTASVAAIRGDDALLRQVLEHLIGNALRYSPDGSTVTVRLVDKPGLGGDSGAPVLGIQVIDQGCGIPDKELAAIFEPFYESSRTATGAGGSGLGLALAKSIVERHRGKLTAANRPEGGAILELTLPAA